MGFFSDFDKRDGSRKQKINPYNILILLLLAPGSIAYGYTASVIGTTLGQPSFNEYFHLLTSSNGTDLISTMNGLFYAGGVIGALVLPTAADKLGRKWAIGISAALCMVSGAVMAGSTHVAEFIAFRFVAGAGAAMMLSAIPLYMNEVVPINMRGGLVNLHSTFYIIGYAIAAWAGFGFSFWTKGGLSTWRPAIAMQAGLSLMELCALYWIPESPRWLVMQDRMNEAKTLLDRLHSDPSDPENEYARAEFYQIQKQLYIDRTLGNTWWHILKKKSYRKRALLAIATGFLWQSSGDLVINNYGPILYKNLGFSPVKQLLYPAAWLTFTVGMSVLAIPIIDRFPRNKLLSIGLLGCMCCLIVEAALVANFVPSNNTNALQAAVAMFFIFQIFDPICLSGPTWVYVGEICPTHLRAKGMCLASAAVCLANVIYLQSAPVAFENIRWKFYLIFIIICFIGAIAIWFMWPDTRGLPLEEVAAIFGDGDEVAIYQREIEIDHNTHTIIDHHAEDRMEKTRSSALESAAKDVPSESDHAKGHISHTEDADIDLSLDHVKKV